MLFTELLQIIDPVSHSGPMNMAIDEALLQRATEPTLRIYGWQEPAISFGYFGSVAEAEQSAAGRELVRRWTGGGLVEHGDDLTYTLIVPREHPFFAHAAGQSYHLIHEALAGAMRAEGIAVRVVPAVTAQAKGACFVNPVQFDVVLPDGRKVAGAAQRRTRWGLLHQGSVLTGLPVGGLGERLPGALGDKVSRCVLSAEVEDAALVLAKTRYASEAWLRKF